VVDADDLEARVGPGPARHRRPIDAAASARDFAEFAAIDLTAVQALTRSAMNVPCEDLPARRRPAPIIGEASSLAWRGKARGQSIHFDIGPAARTRWSTCARRTATLSNFRHHAASEFMRGWAELDRELRPKRTAFHPD